MAEVTVKLDCSSIISVGKKSNTRIMESYNVAIAVHQRHNLTISIVMCPHSLAGHSNLEIIVHHHLVIKM